MPLVVAGTQRDLLCRCGHQIQDAGKSLGWNRSSNPITEAALLEERPLFRPSSQAYDDASQHSHGEGTLQA
jgi:hypothetical protein